MKAVKGILIDFDGTLVDSLPALYTLYEQLLARHGLKATQEEFNRLNGANFNEILHDLNQRHNLGLRIQETRLGLEKELLYSYQHTIPLLPGVTDFLKFAKARNILLGIVTAARRPLLEAALSSRGILQDFNALITGSEVPKGKPDPAGYLAGLQTLNITAEEALAIEDSVNGVEAALKAGLHTLMLAPSGPIHSSNSVAPVKNWNEIITFLQNLGV